MTEDGEIDLSKIDFSKLLTPKELVRRFRKQELQSIYNVYEHFGGDIRQTSVFLGYLSVRECKQEIENYTRGHNVITLPINTNLEIE